MSSERKGPAKKPNAREEQPDETAADDAKKAMAGKPEDDDSKEESVPKPEDIDSGAEETEEGDSGEEEQKTARKKKGVVAPGLGGGLGILPKISLMDAMFIFIPIAFILEFLKLQAEGSGGEDTVNLLSAGIFLTSALGIIPLAGYMGRATEELAYHSGPGIGGLLNVTFGNATELILAFSALRAGLETLVKASLTGSIIGNLLLVLGLSMLAGGAKHKEQKFSPKAAGTYNSLMAMALIGMVIPALFVSTGGTSVTVENVSLGVSVILLVIYALAMVFSLHTHKHIFNPLAEEESVHALWSRKKAMLVLALCTLGVACMSELLVGSVEASAKFLGLNDLFIGVVIVAVIGNAAEHSTAILVALKNKMDLAFNIATGSSAQIALFVAPLLVLVGFAIGNPMNLAFEIFELAAMGLSVAAVIMVTQDGESNWFEGALLLAVYVMMAIVFFFHP